MNFKPEHIELFDRYLSGEMNSDEIKKFKNNLSQNTDLGTEFEEFKAFENSIKDAEIATFKAKLTNWDKKETITKPIKKKPKLFSMRFLAAAAVLTVGALVTISYFTNSLTPSELAENNFTPFDNVITVRGEQAEIDAGLKFYDQGNYQEALKLLTKISGNKNAIFYSAEAYFATKDYDNAVIYYTKIISSESIFNEIATYHKALALLAKENTKKAMETLQSIPKESDYYKQAQEILDQL